MRKHFILLAIAMAVLSMAKAQQNPQIYYGQKAGSIAPGAEMVRMKSFSDVPNYIRFAKTRTISEEKALSYSLQFIKREDAGFAPLGQDRDKYGMTHKRYVQTINGIPLEYSAYLFHSKNGQCMSMNGNIASDPQISGSFTLSPETASELARLHIGAEIYMNETGTDNPYGTAFSREAPSKVYYPDKGELYSNQFRAAWKVEVYALKPYSRQYVYVDAKTGEILKTVSRIHSADVPGTAQTAYSGEQTITTDSYSGGYRLRESGRGNGIATYNCQMTTNYGAAIDFTDNDNYWNNVNADLDQYATDAHFATEKTYDYYYNVHGRNSIDGNGLALNSYVHFNLIEYGYPSNTNAFWNGSEMTYGDGSDGVTPLTTVDIAAHEITHGLTSYTCNLNYQDESGALNESFSDIFGAMVEFYAVPSLADWSIGEDIGATFRSLADPNAYNNPDTYEGNFWHTDASDNGGVHTNMSVLCYWFYLVAEGDSGTNDNGDAYNITGIGKDNAADITFRLQTVYLTSTSEYIDARFYGIQSAVDLFGSCSPEVEVVTNAFYAIGLGNEYVDGVVADFDALYTISCSTPFTVNFQNYSINGNNFTWNFGDGATSNEVNPSHTYTSIGNFDVQLYADGGDCGENTITKSGFVSIDPSNPCITLMPLNGDDSSDDCIGTLFDSGGPEDPYSDNSDATFTISPAGASQIVLTISEFDIEPGSGSTCDYDYIAFYDGTNTSSPLINGTYYCNTTGNPGTITTTGGDVTIAFHSDGGLNLNGFEINWVCIQENAPPTALFSASSTNSCNGRINFTDESLNLPESWAWDFGDGYSSTEQHPEHLYQQSGTYTVSLSVNNANGSDAITKTSYITIDLSAAPGVENQSVCLDSVFTIEVPDNGGDIDWFSDSTCTNLVYSGNSWEHDPISENTTYYLRETFYGEIQNVGATENTGGGGYFGNVDYIHYLIFDAEQDFNLLSVSVNADGAGTRSIALRDQFQNVLDATDVYIPDGVSRIDLNLNVPAGQDLQLVGLGSPNLFRTNNEAYLNYPYTIDGVVSITGSSASTAPLSYYYYFYDWEIEQSPCESETAELQLTVEDCTLDITDHQLSGISIFPNPAEEFLSFNGINSSDFPLSVKISDNQGRIITNSTLSENYLDISELKSGMYILQITGTRGQAYFRLIIK